MKDSITGTNVSKKAFPRPWPLWAPFTRPAISPTFRKAGVLPAGLWYWQRKSHLSSGTGTLLSLGSIVQNGKFYAEDWLLFHALKKVDFPTFGNPTIKGGSKSSNDWGGLIPSPPLLGDIVLKAVWEWGPRGSGRWVLLTAGDREKGWKRVNTSHFHRAKHLIAVVVEQEGGSPGITCVQVPCPATNWFLNLTSICPSSLILNANLFRPKITYRRNTVTITSSCFPPSWFPLFIQQLDVGRNIPCLNSELLNLVQSLVPPCADCANLSNLFNLIKQGCQTHFHREQHQPRGCLQRAECNFRTV